MLKGEFKLENYKLIFALRAFGQMKFLDERFQNLSFGALADLTTARFNKLHERLDAFDNDASKSLNELKDGNRSQVTNLESKIADTEKACEKFRIIHDNLEKEVLKLESDIKILSSQPAAKPAKPTLPAAGTGGRPKRYLVSPPENPSPRSTVSAPARSLNPSTPSSLTGSALRRRRKSFLDSDSDDDLFPK